MLKKRLIFTLLYDNGYYMLSRNFRLQEVGDLNWLRENYDFDAIAYSIDELAVLNVSRSDKDIKKFARHLLELSRQYFLPISAGGGIRTRDDAFAILNSNADKLIVNTPLSRDPALVRSLVETFGSQCVVGSIDCKKIGEDYRVYIDRGREDCGTTVHQALEKALELNIGEIYLTSMDRDGTGFGYDRELIESVNKACRLPIIASGGVGKFEHFVEGLTLEGVTGASTANIYNFMVDGLKNARRYIRETGISLGEWDMDLEHLRGSVLDRTSQDILRRV